MPSCRAFAASFALAFPPLIPVFLAAATSGVATLFGVLGEGLNRLMVRLPA